MALWINDSGASTAEIKSGVAAAQEFFKKLGVAPADIWRAANAGPDDEPAVSLDDQEAAIGYWQEAETVAFRAAFAGWQSQPEAASLVWEGK